MVATIQTLLPYLVVASHALLVVLFVAVLLKQRWINFLGKHALLIGLLVALSAVAGSLFYSELVGYEACLLCWWQRLFIYPQAILFAVALWKRDRNIFSYSAVLSTFAGIVALYHSYVYWGGESLLPCTALGGACSKIYVMEFGYITIPSMSLTVVLYFLLLAWINRLYKNENSHA